MAQQGLCRVATTDPGDYLRMGLELRQYIHDIGAVLGEFDDYLRPVE
jgi:hypothetical protein